MHTDNSQIIIESPKRKSNFLSNRVIILSILGLVLGTFFDYLHVATGTIYYTNPKMFGLAWWVPLLYFNASLGIGLSHPMMDKAMGRQEYLPFTFTKLLAGFIGLCIIWSASGILPFSSVIITAILLPISLIMWLNLDKTREGLIIALITAIIGCLMEIILSKANYFHHTNQNIMGIPYWLPAIYIAASVGLGNIGRWLYIKDK